MRSLRSDVDALSLSVFVNGVADGDDDPGSLCFRLEGFLPRRHENRDRFSSLTCDFCRREAGNILKAEVNE